MTRCARGDPRPRSAAAAQRLEMPVFVANGDSDPMILPHYSYLLAGLIPQARLKIYPDSAHGFLFQHHAEFAADVEAFLDGRQLSTGGTRRDCWPSAGRGPAGRSVQRIHGYAAVDQRGASR